MAGAETPPTLSRATLRLVHAPEPNGPTASVWLIELHDVRWIAPTDWIAQLQEAVGADPDSIEYSREADAAGSEIMKIAAYSNKGVAQLITIRHRLSSLFEAWCEPVDGSAYSHGEPVDRRVAEARVRDILRDDFGVSGNAELLETDLENRSEWIFKLAVGPTHYVGTARRDHRTTLFHVAHPLNG